MTKALKFFRPFVHSPKEKKTKYCSACGKVATQEACFDVGDGATMIEKYCDECVKKITKSGK